MTDPERSEGFQSGLGVKSVFTSFRHTLAVAPTKTARPSGYRIGLKKYYAPGNATLGLDWPARNGRCSDHGRNKIRPKKCLTRSKSTSTGPIRLGTVGMR